MVAVRLLSRRAAILGTLLSATATTAQDSASEWRWAGHLTQMTAGEAELRAGAATRFSLLSSRSDVSLALIGSARLGLTDTVQLALPLIASVRVWGNSPRGASVSLSGGVVGVGWSPATGAFVSGFADVSVRWVGGDVAYALSLAGATGNLPADRSGVMRLAAAVALRLSERAVLGLSTSISWNFPVTQALGPAIGAGSTFSSPLLLAPVFRLRLVGNLALECWLQLDWSGSPRGLSGIAGLGLAWSPQLWRPGTP